jgi:zona occludens toxin
MNVDRHIHGLCGRHLHVRRMGNMGLTIVYEWDHCSRSLMYSKSIAKSPWRYDKSVFELYKSAELHTKSPRRIPSVVWLILLAFGSISYLGPTAYSRISARSSGESENVVRIAHKQPLAASSASAALPASLPASLPPEPVSEPVPVAAPVIAGCILVASRCECFDSVGAKLDDSAGMCQALVKIPPPIDLPASIPAPIAPPAPIYVNFDRVATVD